MDVLSLKDFIEIAPLAIEDEEGLRVERFSDRKAVNVMFGFDQSPKNPNTERKYNVILRAIAFGIKYERDRAKRIEKHLQRKYT